MMNKIARLENVIMPIGAMTGSAVVGLILLGISVPTCIWGLRVEWYFTLPIALSTMTAGQLGYWRHTPAVLTTPEPASRIQSGDTLNDHKWHDIDYWELKDWAKGKTHVLNEGRELTGAVFLYRRHMPTGKYQIRLKDKHYSSVYRK